MKELLHSILQALPLRVYLNYQKNRKFLILITSGYTEKLVWETQVLQTRENEIMKK